MKTIRNIAIVAAVVAAVSCQRSDHWSVGGTITGADGELLTLERSFNGMWSVIDSARLDSKGSYKFETEPVGYPDIYRLSVNGKSAYFPIDSLESVTLSGDAATISTDYSLAGSASAEMFANINAIINKAVQAKGQEAVTDSILKRELSGMVLGDMSSIVSYYIINKEIGGRPIFNPADKGDLRVIGAVVNTFSALRPTDPRTRYMEQRYLAQRRALTNATTVVEAPEIGFPEITLKDATGSVRTLTSLVAEGKPVIVNFTAYAAENSPAINIALAGVYNAGGVNIYQVSVDADEYLWREAARNLPWTTVLLTPRDGDRALRDYNVTTVPQTFIIGRDGVLRERVDDITTLSEIIKKYR